MSQTEKIQSSDPFYYKHRNFFVGVFVLVPLLFIPALLIIILVRSELLENWVELYIRCETATGLKKGTDVNILGTKIGHVRTVTLNDNGYVDVELRVKKRFSHFLHKDTKARLKQKNFVVGDWEIDLTIGNSQLPVIDDGDTLAVEYQIRLEKMVETFTQMIAPLESIFASLAKGEGIIKYIFGEDTLISDVHSIIGRINALFTEVNRTLVNANSMIDTIAEFGARGIETVDSLKVFSNHADQLIGDMGVVVEDIDSLLGDVKTLPVDIDSLILLLRKDVYEAEILLNGIQNHWFFRRTIEKQRALEEKGNGSK